MRRVVPGTLEGLAEAMRAAEEFCQSSGIRSDARAKVLTALDEVLANVVHHGLAGASGTIDVTMTRTGDGIMVGISDSAAAFDPLLLPAADTTLPLDQRRIGGLGIALVRALTDNVVYERRAERNHLTLTWRVGAGPAKDEHDD